MKKVSITSAIRYVWEITKRLHLSFAAFMVLISIDQLISILLSVFVGKGIDSILKSNSLELDSVKYIALGFLGFSIGRGVVAMTQMFVHIGRIAYRLDTLINQLILSKVFCMSPGQASRGNAGLRVETLRSGTAAIQEIVELVLNNICPLAVRLIASTTILFWIHWSIGLSILISVTLFIWVGGKINSAYSDDFRRIKRMESALDTQLWEIIKHLKHVIMSATDRVIFDEHSRRLEETAVEGKKVWLSYNKAAGLLRNWLLEHTAHGCIFALTLYLVSQRLISVGDVAVAIGIIGQVYNGLNGVGSVQRKLIRNSINILKLKAALEQVPECVDVEGAIPLANPKGRIEFRKVSFSYPGAESIAAVRNLSFTIEPGETVALVGPSGGGKSTIVNLLLRGNTPQTGHILIDDIDLAEIAIRSWRENVGIVEQQAAIWDDTLRRNITRGIGRDLTDDALWDIAERAQIGEFRERLGPTWIDTEVGDNGMELSGGQRQRVSIARILARDPKVLVFDEATSALDTRTEASVQAAIQEALKGRTGIIIAHRLSTVRKADRIIVLDKGEIVGVGNHDELMVTCTVYQDLVRHDART